MHNSAHRYDGSWSHGREDRADGLIGRREIFYGISPIAPKAV